MKQLEFLTAHPHESSAPPVYIVAIGWLFVIMMMAITSTSFLSGVATLLCYGILPLAMFLWIVGTPQRRRRAASRDAVDEKPDQGD